MRRPSLLSGALAGLLLVSGLVASAPSATAAPVATPAVTASPAAVDAPAPDRPMPAAPEAEGIEVEPAPAAGTTSVAAATPGFTDVVIPARADIVTHRVTIALVAPQGTTPSFEADEARRALEIVDSFYDRETGGAIRFELEQLIDWQYIDEPIACSDTGSLHDWIQRRTGWQSGPARHIVAMVPPGDPCPGWANGEQPGDPDDGGRSFQGGPDAYLLAHELGHNLSLPHAYGVQCGSTWDYAPGTDCPREEYGNRTDVMGDSWSFLPLSAPSLARLGTLEGTRQPVCGAPRTATIETLGAGPGAARALTWTDPADTEVRYWVQYNDRADATSDGGAYSSPWQVDRAVSGVQILRSNPTQPYAGDLLERPGDSSAANEFVQAGETVALNSGMSVRVDALDAVSRTARVTVTVPCVEYVGDVTRYASPSASYTSDWSTVRSAVDGDTATAWSTWPRVGEQWYELRWPQPITVDRASVRFASDAADSAQQGLIPARSWRVERYDDTTATWKPVTGATPAVSGRARDAVNTTTFTPVTTSAIRVLFQAWGTAEYGGSTGVAELAVNAVAPVASLAARGVARTIPTGTTRDLEQGVDVRDAAQRGLPGRSVTFTITGPATFTNGARTATVLSGSTGVAALPSVRTGTATGSVTVSAGTPGVTAVALPTTTVAVPPSVTATASTRTVLGSVVLTVVAKNTGTRAADLRIVTAYGSATSAGVAPGASVTKTFATRRATVPAGTAQVTATAGGLSTTVTASYAAR